MFLCSGIVIVYCLRVNMSVAAQLMRSELKWTEAQKGLVLSSFYWGYALGQIPSSKFAQFYGAKRLFGFSILIPSLLTLLVPMACRYSFTLALCIRALIGLTESAAFPACYHFFPNWIPNSQKTVMISVFMSGIYVGSIMGFSLSGVIASTEFQIFSYTIGGWPFIFYFFGVLGVLWFPLWMVFSYETPEDHPEISDVELEYLNRGKDKFSKNQELFSRITLNDNCESGGVCNLVEKLLVTDTDSTPNTTTSDSISNGGSPGRHTVGGGTPPLGGYTSSLDKLDAGRAADEDRMELAYRTPWLAFLSHPASLALLLMQWICSWTSFMLLSEIPSFLTDDLGFQLETAGFVSVGPYVAQFVSSIAFGVLFEYLQIKCGWRTRTIRQVAQYIALLGSGSLLVGCSFIHSRDTAVALLVLALFCFGASQSGIACAYLDVTPNYSSVLHALGNSMGAVAGILSPIFVAYCTFKFPGTLGWRIVFMTTAAQGACCLVIWALFQTSDIVPELNAPRLKIKRIN